ncbi:MAG: B12-binding domain-containing radical SAM protein [Ignavibacteriae bacterium]|nr:B12-binding domain-containing radical SAM protein [Ignavibacteriota bacterium]
MKRHRILLYNPRSDFYTMPLGLLAVASALDPELYDVQIIDGRLEEQPINKLLERAEGALCLGITVLTGMPIRDALTISRSVKQRFPNLPIVWGGWHPSLFPLETLEEASIDITVQGQGEVTFAELVHHLGLNKSIEGVAGIAWKREGKPMKNPPRGLAQMDTLPAMNYNQIPVRHYYKLKKKEQLDYISSTGCFFRCAFCADPFVFKRQWTGINPIRIADELEKLWKEYRFKEVAFQDETFFTYRKRVTEMAEEFIRRELPFRWTGTMRADQGARMTEEEWELCARSGMDWLLIGVESGSQEMLDWMQKDITLDQVFHCARMCARYGIRARFPVIVGFPGETNESVQASLNVAKQLRAMHPSFDTAIFYFKPYPGSRITDEAIKGGYRLPTTVEEWADFDFVDGSSGEWVSQECYTYVERFKFYSKFAWGYQPGLRKPLQWISRARCKRDFYRFPVEKRIIELLRPSVSIA